MGLIGRSPRPSRKMQFEQGYTAADILEQCRKLDEAGMEYYFVYMTGLAGKGKGYWNAIKAVLPA